MHYEPFLYVNLVKSQVDMKKEQENVAWVGKSLLFHNEP